MKKRWIAIILVIAVLIIGAVVATLLFKDKSQNDLLTSEINSLSETNTNTDIKTTGQYGIVEKLVKEDYKTYIESVNKLRANYEELSQAKVINLDNYQNDGPEFANSLTKLNKIKSDNAESSRKFSSQRIADKSRWFVGSSSKSTSGLPNSALASSTLTFKSDGSSAIFR